MADAPAGGAGGAKQDPQALIAKHAAVTQSGAAGDAAIVSRVEASIKNSPMGWLQGVLGETGSRAASEQGEVHGKLAEHQDLVSKSSKDAPKDAGPAPAPGPATHPAVPHPAAANAKAGVVAPAPAAGGSAVAHAPIAGTAVPKSAPASAPAAAPAPTIAGAVASAGNDSQLDGILNAYTPKSPQTTQTLGRIKQMGDVAQGFNGQLDVYVSQGGAIDSTIAHSMNFLGAGKDANAIWRNNPYRKVHGVLGGIMTGMSAVKSVCSIVGSICGKLGMVLTVIGLLGMIFPPIGAAVSGIARILSVVGIICDAISFVLSGILTGLNGVVLAQQIAAGASAEEKAASADMMMSEANEAASGFVNLAMMFGPKFMKGMLGSSKGVVASLLKRAKATIGRISLKVSSNVSHFANKIVRKLGFGGAKMARVGGAWKDTGLVAGMKEKWAGSKVGKVFNGAPQHLEMVQEKLMAKYGNTTWAKNLDRAGAWGGSVAERFDLEAKVGKMGESSGKWVGGLGADTKLGKSMAAAAERSELQTRELAMKMESRDAAHLEETRWKNELNRRQAANPEHIRDRGVEDKFVGKQGDRVRDEASADFAKQEKQRESKERLEQLRTDRFDRRNDEYYENAVDRHGVSARDRMMGTVHDSRQRRYDLEASLKPQESERRDLLAKATKSAEDQSRLTALNSELKPLDEARRMNKMYETDMSTLASGSEHVRKPEYHNWKDVGSNAWEATSPVLEMMDLKDRESGWAAAEKANLKRQTKYNKGAAQANAAGRGGHGTLEEIASDARARQLDELTAFVRATPGSTTLSSRVGSMLSPITSRVPAAAPAPAAAPTHAPTAAPTQAITSAPTQAPAPQGGVSVSPTADHKPGEAGVDTSIAMAAQVQEPAAPPAPVTAHEDAGADADGGGEALPYWPALLPEFDQAQHDFGWMRNVAVQFKKAQIEGKQKAVDTLAVYGRYKEYSQLRSAAAKKNQEGAAATGQATAQNVGHASQTEGQAGQGEAKQGEAKGAANDKAATELPEPESRGFWGRILGAVKRWAKNKAAQVFGWIQEKIASVIMKGLCGVSMGDMREYAGALRRQQQAAHGVADDAGKTSGAAATTSIKLGSDATKEAQGAADAIGECDKNIVDADTFMTDVASFEGQLAEEKANAQIFISQVQAAAHAEQARKQAEEAAHAAEEAKANDRSAAIGGAPATTAAPSPAPAPTAMPVHEQEAPQPATAPEDHGDAAAITAAAGYVASESEIFASRLEARADDYTNQLALALTNKTGKSAEGVDLKGPAKKESKHIVEEFKHEAAHTKIDMEAFHAMPIEPSQAKKIAEQIIQSAQHLEGSYTQSENALDELFARTYNGIKDGRRTLKSRMLDGDNAIGAVNHAGDAVENKAIDTALPAMNAAWNTVSKPIQVAPSAPAPAPAPDQAPPSPVMVADNAKPRTAVQAKSVGESTATDPDAVASAGVTSANSRLPHHERIQASFGRHDISGIRAQVGGDAATSSKQLGASAYATGDKIGFANSPDLHTAAHEAAHVVQQRQGVSLKGGLDGGKGDPYEQHADRVADSVVRGESAEALLDGGSGGGGAAVQRQTDPNQAPIIVDAGPVMAGQMLKQGFLDALKPHVVEAANAELGRLGSAIGCPYIEQYFAKYSALPAESVLQLINRWAPSSRGVTSASALVPMLMERVRAGVKYWKESGKLPPDLAAAEPSLAASAQAPAAAPSGNVQRKSLDGLEQQLGAGEAVDQKAAAPMGAGDARIHRGPEADKMAAEQGAVAFAAGNNVVMSSNAPKQGSLAGDALLAHELAHTAQQRDSSKDPAERAKPIGTEEQSAETNANAVAEGAVAGNSNLARFNAFANRAGDAMRTNVQLQRCSNEAAKEVNSKSYFDEHETEIAATAADQIATYPFPTGDASAKWASGGNEKFSKALSTQIRNIDGNKLKDILQPESAGVLVDQNRVMTQKQYTDLADGQDKTQTTNFGPDRYFEATGITIANAIARRTNESLKREVPRYIQAKLATVGEPGPNGLLAGHPIDPLILVALAAGGVLDIDQNAFKKEHPDLGGQPKQLTALPAGSLIQEKDPNRKNWYRLTLPNAVPAEQIALTLLNDQTQAYRVEVAHPLYGLKQFGDQNLIEGLADAKQGAFLDEIALNQAQSLGMPSSNPPVAVIAQIRKNALTIRTSVDDAAKTLGYGLLPQYADKLSERATKLENGHDDAETKKWDVQSRAQFEIIKQAAKGLDADRKRQTAYAAQFKGKDAIPDQQRQALFDDATLWAKAVEASDAVKTAEAMLQTAFQNSATLEFAVLEQQLNLPQAAADLPNQDKESDVNKDMHPEDLAPREVELRKKLGLMRQQVLTDPSKIDASSDKVPEETRKLVFQSNVVLQAEQMNQSWKILDATSGFWAWVTGDSDKINGLKAQSAGYYAQWNSVYADITAKRIDDAQTKYEKLVGDYTFQHFLGTVKEAVQKAEAKQLLAKLIGMIVITIVSMGVGTIVEGLVGGAVVVAGAVEGTEVVGAVTTGLGMGRTAGAVAGFIAETGTFSLASNLLMSKDHSATAILTEFGKNIVMFGALRGMGKLLEVAGVGKIIKAGAQAEATTSAQVLGATASVATHVAMGGAGVLAGIIEAKIEAAIKGRNLTDDQIKEMIEMNVAQAIIMVIVGRLMQSPMRALKIEAAYQGSKWRMADAAAQHLESLSAPYNTPNPKITEGQLRDLIQKDLAQIQLEKAAMEEVRATLEKQGKSTASIDAHLAQLDKFGDASSSALLLVGLKSDMPGHFSAPAGDIPVLKQQHLKLGSTWDEVPAKPGEPRTYVVTNAAGERVFITEELPEWATTPNGQRIMTATKRANIDESVIIGLTDVERNAILKLEKAIDANDPQEIAKAKQELGKLTKAQQDALEKALTESTPKPDQRGKIVDPMEQTKLDQIRQIDPNGKVRSEAELSNADVALSMNSQLDKVKPSELDAIVAKYPDQAAHVRQVIAKSSGFGNMESMNDLFSGVAQKGGKLYIPGRGSLADNVMYMQSKGAFKGGSLTFVHAIEPGTVVLLDGVVLAKIKAEPAFAKSLVDNNAKLLNPRGFETGNNMYNSPDPAAIAARTKTILDKANAIVASDKIPFDQAVNQVLDANVTEALKGAGIDAQLKPGQLEAIDPGSNIDITSSAKIADHLNDHAGITPAKVGEALKGFQPEDAALLREMLAHQAEIFSSRRQAQEIKGQSDQVNQAAATAGVSDPANVYYFIYKENKSYGMLAMAHREMTNTAPDHYVNGPSELKTLALPDSKVLVILDDVAGSGQSLSSAYTQAREAGFKGEIIISPMVSTHDAPTTVQNGFNNNPTNPDGYGQPADAKTQFVPRSYANALHDSAWYQSLVPAKQARLDYLIQDKGYGDNGLSMAFPYMSPDNNNYMFAGTMADQFIVNNNGAAAKNKSGYDPNANK